MKKKVPFIILWILFAFLLFWDACIESSLKISNVLELITVGLSIYLICKNKLPSKKYIIISIVFMILVNVSYLGYQQDMDMLFYGIKAAIPTLLCGFAVFSVMEKYGEYKLLVKDNKLSPLYSVLIAVGSGIVLAVINSFIGQQKLNFNFSFAKLLVCFSPAIFE